MAEIIHKVISTLDVVIVRYLYRKRVWWSTCVRRTRDIIRFVPIFLRFLEHLHRKLSSLLLWCPGRIRSNKMLRLLSDYDSRITLRRWFVNFLGPELSDQNINQILFQILVSVATWNLMNNIFIEIVFRIDKIFHWLDRNNATDSYGYLSNLVINNLKHCLHYK